MRCHHLTILAVFRSRTDPRRHRAGSPIRIDAAGATAHAAAIGAHRLGRLGAGATPSSQRINVPPAPALDPVAALKTFRLAPGYRIELVAAEPMVQQPDLLRLRSRRPHLGGRIPGLHARSAGSWRGRSDLPRRRARRYGCRRPRRPIDGLPRWPGHAAIARVRQRRSARRRTAAPLVVPGHRWRPAVRPKDARRHLRVSPAIRSTRRTACGTASTTGCTRPTSAEAPSFRRRPAHRTGHHPSRPVRRHLRRRRTVPDVARESRAHRRPDPGRVSVQRNPALVESYRRSAGRQRAIRDQPRSCRGRERRSTCFPAGSRRRSRSGRSSCATTDGSAPTPSSSGTSFYNGHQFPADAYGNVFVPESGGHLVGRLKLDGGIDLRATRFYPDEQEFLTSTDERFRPVNSRVGPDGALYIADMYHGIIEHVIFMVPYLERQIRARRLDEGLDKGRIYRVVVREQPDRSPPAAPRVGDGGRPGLAPEPRQRLVAADRPAPARGTARCRQRFSPCAISRAPARVRWDGCTRCGRCRACSALDWPLLLGASADEDDRVRAAAVRLCEHLDASAPAARTLDHLAGLAADRSPRVRLQVALTAGSLQAGRALDLLAALLEQNDDRLFRAAIMTGLRSREIEFLALLTVDRTAAPSAGLREMVRWIAETVLHEGRPERIEQVLSLADTLDERRAIAMRDSLLEGMAAAVPRQAKPLPPIETPPRAARPHASRAIERRQDAGARLAPAWPLHLAGSAGSCASRRAMPGRYRRQTCGSQRGGGRPTRPSAPAAISPTAAASRTLRLR